MRNPVLIAVLILCGAAFAQKNDGIRDTRIGGIRPGTIKRADQKQDPDVKKEIIATSKETGISRGKLLNEFRDTQKKFAETARQQAQMDALTAKTGVTAAASAPPVFTVQDFHKAKVFSVQNKISMDEIIAKTAKLGNVEKAVEVLKSK